MNTASQHTGTSAVPSPCKCTTGNALAAHNVQPDPRQWMAKPTCLALGK